MKKKTIIGLALLMGGMASFIAMIPTSLSSKAAVLVHDTENIVQAVKEVAQTAQILSTNQKQLEIMNINIKSLDIEKLREFSKGQKEATGGCFGTGNMNMTPEELARLGKDTGVLNKHKTTTAILESTIGTVEGVFNGRMSAEDLYEQAERTQKALDATYKDAAEAAKNVQNADAKLGKVVDSAVDAANNAKGKKEVQQAQVAIAAVNAIETRNTNHLLANILAVMVDDAYSRNIDKAKKLKKEKESKERVKKFVGDYSESKTAGKGITPKPVL